MTGKTGKNSIAKIRNRVDQELARINENEDREKQMILLKCRNLLLDYQARNGGI